MIDSFPGSVRDENIRRAGRISLRLSKVVPPVWGGHAIALKDLDAIFARAMAVFGFLCVCFEPKRKRAEARIEIMQWLVKNGCRDGLVESENAVIEGRVGVTKKVLDQAYRGVESLLALMWVLGKSDLSIERYVDDSFGSLFPSIAADESVDTLRAGVRLRSVEEVYSEFDFYYCLHWYCRERRVTGVGRLTPIEEYAVTARRHGLEWVLSSGHWDDISLDT